MKKIFIPLFIIVLAIGGVAYINSQSENGIVEELRYVLLPDPMANNSYTEGECTYYVFDRIKAQGDMIETSWWHARYWSEKAEEDGYAVNDQPAPGAILQTERGELGHVAYIESVDDDGSIHITEMNYTGPYEVNERIIDASDTDRYEYIHPKENPRPKSLEENA